MSLTYDNAADAAADRAQLAALLESLNASELTLRRDECGAYRIKGTRGALYTWGDGKTWYVSIETGSDKRDTYARKALDFCQPEPGWRLRLMSLPTPEKAEALRSALGIRKRRSVSEETLAALARMRETNSRQSATYAPQTAENEESARMVAEEAF